MVIEIEGWSFYNHGPTHDPLRKKHELPLSRQQTKKKRSKWPLHRL